MAMLLPYSVRGVAGLPLRFSFRTNKSVEQVNGLIPKLNWSYSNGILEISGTPAGIGNFAIEVKFNDGTSQTFNLNISLEAV